jgi:DNA polymerase-3 subunit epsilon
MSDAGSALQTARSVQATPDELGTPLAEITFVVVDLETTGESPQECRITEIGAVKIRGGQLLGEFQTLVNPGEPIPAFITALTGITDTMVATAPRIGDVLSTFWEYCRGAVLVAHNAPFDIGFLKAACAATGRCWPDPPVLDTAQLARHVVTRDEARDRKLATLARLFRSTTTPDHRALADARTTVDVLHGLIERVGNLGVTSLEELTTFTSRVPAATPNVRLVHLNGSWSRPAATITTGVPGLPERRHRRVITRLRPIPPARDDREPIPGIGSSPESEQPERADG